MGVLLALALLAPAPHVMAPVPTLSSRYVIDQMEMAGGLELSPKDGRFRYGLDYGAVSEFSEGYWSPNGGAIELTTNPMPPKNECNRGFASACFDHTRLTFEGENLILYRWDAKIILKPVRRAKPE